MKVIIQREGEFLVAQCLEHDICAQGSNMTELMDRLTLTVELECDERGGTLDDIAPAPEEYHKMWGDAFLFEQRQSNYQMAMAA
jgi:hypothetical protein